MNYLKRVVATVAVLVLIFSLAACSTAVVQPTTITTLVATTTIPATTSAALSPTAAVATPSPTLEDTGDTDVGDGGGDNNQVPDYNISDLVKLGLTNKQYQKIDALIDSALEMYDDNGHTKYFSDAASLTTNDQLSLAYEVLWNHDDVIGADLSKDPNAVENIIKSAFNITYVAKEGDNFDDLLVYKDGKFTLDGADGAPIPSAFTYGVTRISSDKLLLNFDIIVQGDEGDEYQNKAQAIIQEDPNSIFGYHLLSLTKCKDAKPKFTSATASSNLPKSGSKNFKPSNIIDKKGNTAWVTEKGTGEWVMLSAGKPQAVSGLEFNIGDCTSDDTVAASGQPSRVRLEFSDGTSTEYDLYEAYFTYSNQCITFNKVINTTYVKITILDIDPDMPQTKIYISEVSPF